MDRFMFKNPYLNKTATFYLFFSRIGNNLQSLFLFYLRFTWGYQFAVSGWLKLHGIQATATFFESLHIPHPLFSAYLVGWVESFCGICLFLGFASRIVTIPLILIMLTAISTAHAPDISNFHFLLDPSSLVKLPPYLFLITCLTVFCFGPGRISIDAWLKRWVQKKPTY